MKYSSGTDVQEGDEVRIKHRGYDEPGTVVQIIVPDTSDAKTWGAPEGGVLIEGGGLGLSLTTNLEKDPDVVFVRRRSRA